MIVLVIVTGMITMAMPYINNRNTKVKGFLREFTVLSRELHTKAKLQGVMYRLVLELPEENPSSTTHREPRYWVEKSTSQTVLKEDEEKIEDVKKDDEKKAKVPGGFEIDMQIMKKPKTLPGGLYFEKVELTRVKNPITNGKAYIHYLPQGLVDEAAIFIKGEGKQAWTVAIHPLTGKAELISKSISLREIKDK
jgi:general secretion pathway protein H